MPDRSDRPRIAVTFRHDSPSAMLLHQAAGDRYQLIWVIDSRTAALGTLRRLLGRLGSVVDIAGLGPADAVAAVAATTPTGITTYSDDLITSTAWLADGLGLRNYSVETATRLVDKGAQRAAFAAAGVDVPGYRLLVAGIGVEQALVAVDGLRFPAVLKPRRGQGSRNTFAVNGLAELRAALEQLGPSATPFDLILEEYIPDTDSPDADFAGYLSVESVAFDGHVHHLATTGRFPPVPPFRESGFFIPSPVTGLELARVLDLASVAIHALGVTDGTLHTEIKLTPEGPRVIEVNGRLGGGIPEMLSSVSGVNLFRDALDVAAGCYVRPAGPAVLTGTAYLFYVHASVGRGTVTEVDGLDDLGQLAIVHNVFLNRPPGSVVDWHDGNHGYLYAVSGVVRDEAALRTFARSLPGYVTIGYAPASGEPAPEV